MAMRGTVFVIALLVFGCSSDDSKTNGHKDGGDGIGGSASGGSAGDASLSTGGSAGDAQPDSTTLPPLPIDPCANDSDGKPPSGPTFFVAPGVAGDGTSWANAWQDVVSIDWSSIVPGSTICIAGGSYGSLGLGANGTADARICIKRAVASDERCGSSSAGWNAAFDAQVVLDGISASGNAGAYVTIDGRIPYAGILVDDASLGESYAVDLNHTGANYFRLYNVDIAGHSTTSTDFTGEGRCVSAIADQVAHGLTIAYSKLHGKPTLVLTSRQHDMVFEHNRLYDNVVGNPAAWHPNVWVSLEDDVNVAWRYNDVTNWMVEGIMMCPNGTGCAPCSDWFIYGNVWHDAPAGSTARVLEGQYVTHGAMYLYNNTFVDFAMVMGSQGNGGNFSGGSATNNLMWKTGGDFGAWNLTETTNLVPASDPFVGSGTGDFHLASGSAAVDVGSPVAEQNGLTFDKDADGTVRGADGKWDVGAFERE